MKRAEIVREIREIEELTPAPAIPTGRADGGVGEAGRRRSARLGRRAAGGRGRIDRRRRSTCRMEDGSFLAQGYAPTKHTVEMTVKTDVAPITAFRLELLNDPNLPLGGPGRSIKGTAALTEFRVEAAPADGNGQDDRRSSSRRATADVNPPETPLEPIFDDKSGKKRVTGPDRLRHRRQGRDRLGHRRRPGPSQPAAQGGLHGREADRVPRRHDPDVPPDAEPRRLEQRRQPELQPRPVPAVDHDRAGRRSADPVPSSVREILAIPPEQRTAAQTAAVFSYWRTTVPEWKEANDWIESLWKQHPEGSTQLALCGARAAAADPHAASAAISSSRARRSSRACRVLEPAARRARRRPG